MEDLATKIEKYRFIVKYEKFSQEMSKMIELNLFGEDIELLYARDSGEFSDYHCKGYILIYALYNQYTNTISIYSHNSGKMFYERSLEAFGDIPNIVLYDNEILSLWLWEHLEFIHELYYDHDLENV